MTRSQRATENFKAGYNCAQAIVLAFADLLPVGEAELLRMASSFGGGMGRLREVCGAASGMFLVAGLLFGYDTPETGEVKAAHYARVQELARRFEERRGSIVCRDLLGLQGREAPTPSPRTSDFYEKRPCAGIIADAAEILEEFIGEEMAKQKK